MRALAGSLLIVAAVVQLLLGALLVLSAHTVKQEARAEAGDLSSVSADLVSEEELAAMRKKGEAQTRGAGMRPLLLGGVTLAAALLLLVSSVVTLLRRGGNLLRLGPGVLSLACLAAILALEGGARTALIAFGLLLAGLLLTVIDSRRAAAARDA